MGKQSLSLHNRAISLFLEKLRTLDELYLLALGDQPQLWVSVAYFRTEEDCRIGHSGTLDIILNIECSDPGHKAALILLKTVYLEAANALGFNHLAFTVNGKADFLYPTCWAIESL
ncbi:MAG: hypothetical protein ACM37W_09170 [Actinomycetota bacterium]